MIEIITYGKHFAMALQHFNKRFFLMKTQLRAQTTATNIIGNSSSEKLIDVQSELENARPFSEMPYISGFEMIRNHFPGGKYYKKDATEIIQISTKDYGPILSLPSLFGKPGMVVTHNPYDFERVFRIEGQWPARPGLETIAYHRSTHQAQFYNGVGGLVATQGETWGKFRSIVNPVLMQPKTIRMYLQKMADVDREFVERIKEIRDPETNEMPDNFKEEIYRFTFESICVVALDRQLGLLRSNTIDPKIKKYFENVSELFELTGELDLKPSLWKIIATPKFKRLMGVLDEIQDTTSNFVNDMIERLEDEKRRGIEKPENEKGVLEKLLKIDRHVATVMAMDLLMAGVDTTTTSLVSTLLSIAKHPEKQAKLREEVRRILPKKDSDFSVESLNDMAYLRACIKESLRMYPLTVGNARIAQRDVVLSGFRVPKGTEILVSTTSLNRDENYYRRANEYLPERWLRTPKDECPNELKASHPFVYLPFGFGPRSCIGKRIAELELELFLARMIRNFEIAFNYSTEKPFKSVLINVPNINLKFRFTDLQD